MNTAEQAQARDELVALAAEVLIFLQRRPALPGRDLPARPDAGRSPHADRANGGAPERRH